MSDEPLATNRKTRMLDWIERRNELLQLPSPSTFELMQIKVLGYLIDRYRASPIANGAARFSPRERSYLNRRLIVVHEHWRLGRGQPTCSRAEAEHRIQTSIQKFADKAIIPDINDPPPEPSSVPPVNWFQILSQWIAEMVHWNLPSPRTYKNSRSRQRTKLKTLVSRLANTKKQEIVALRQLDSFRNQDLHHVYLKLWRIHVLGDHVQGRVLRELEVRICAEENVAKSAEAMRETLGDEPAKLRLAALKLLERIGHLDDIPLFADLLRLPTEELSNEEPAALMEAMRVIAHRSDEPKRLRDFQRTETCTATIKS